MHLRKVGAVAMALFVVSLALPAFQQGANPPTMGWEAAGLSGQIAVGVLLSPWEWKGLAPWSAGAWDRGLVYLCLCGAMANFCTLTAIASTARRSSAMTLVYAGFALTAAVTSLLAVSLGEGRELLIGSWLWFGIPVWLTVTAARDGWRQVHESTPTRNPRNASGDRGIIQHL